MNLYVYLYDETSGGGHKVRAEKSGESFSELKFAKKYIFGGRYDTIFIDVRECDIKSAKLFREHCRTLVFIDDYGPGAMKYADKIIVNIPYYAIPDDPRIERHDIDPNTIKRLKVYVYCGYSDPYNLMPKALENIKFVFWKIAEPYCVIGEGFSKEQIENLGDVKTIPLGKYKNCDLAICTWGLHFLEICQKIPTIPAGWDDHTEKLIEYFAGRIK